MSGPLTRIDRILAGPKRGGDVPPSVAADSWLRTPVRLHPQTPPHCSTCKCLDPYIDTSDPNIPQQEDER